MLTALRLVRHVATVDAPIAEPIAGYTLVNGLALELVVGTRVHCVSIVEVVVELVCISRVEGGLGERRSVYANRAYLLQREDASSEPSSQSFS